MNGVGETDRAQEAAAGFRHDADRGQVPDVGAGGLDQESVHRCIEERVIGDVIDVAVMVVVHPPGGDWTKDREIGAARQRGFRHGTPKVPWATLERHEQEESGDPGVPVPPAPLARPRNWPRAAGASQRVYRDHPVRSHEVRGRQGVGLPACRPAAAVLGAAPGPLWLRAEDLLCRARAQAGAGLEARRRRSAGHLRAERARDYAQRNHRALPCDRRAADDRSR